MARSSSIDLATVAGLRAALGGWPESLPLAIECDGVTVRVASAAASEHGLHLVLCTVAPTPATDETAVVANRELGLPA